MDSIAQVIPELGLHFYKATCLKDEEFSFRSFTNNNELDTDSRDYFCVVAAGSFYSENDLRDPMTFKATRRRVADGMVLPGNNKFKALEDGSVYYCLSVLPKRFATFDFHAMYKLKQQFQDAGSSVTLDETKDELMVFSLGALGTVTIGDQTQPFEDGKRYMVPAGGTLTVDFTTAGHVVVGRRPAAAVQA